MKLIYASAELTSESRFNHKLSACAIFWLLNWPAVNIFVVPGDPSPPLRGSGDGCPAAAALLRLRPRSLRRVSGEAAVRLASVLLALCTAKFRINESWSLRTHRIGGSGQKEQQKEQRRWSRWSWRVRPGATLPDGGGGCAAPRREQQSAGCRSMWLWWLRFHSLHHSLHFQSSSGWQRLWCPSGSGAAGGGVRGTGTTSGRSREEEEGKMVPTPGNRCPINTAGRGWRPAAEAGGVHLEQHGAV